MRLAGLIFVALAGAAIAAPCFAAPTVPDDAAPRLRYSVETPPGRVDTAPQPSQQQTQQQGQPQTQAKAQPQTSPNENVTVNGYHGYRLGSGDKVHVTVYGENDLTGDFEVSGSGRIAFPLIGEVRAYGLTAPQLGDELTQKLANGYLKNPRVAVEVTTYRPFYIIGQVNNPGRYAYTDGMTAMNAIALAGGFTPHAVESYIYVRHAGQTKEMRLPADETTEIEPGDVVRVSESGFWSMMRVLQPVTALIGAARYGIP